MSLPRPSGLKAPSKIGKPTGLPLPKSTSTPVPDRAKSAIAKSARAAGISSSQADKYASNLVSKLPGPDVEFPPPPSDDFKIGDRVWVGGSKPGVIAFLGETQFAQGEWAGVVLDRPEGKNDGSVKGVRYFQCEADRGVFARITKLSRTPGVIPPAPKDDCGASETSLIKPNGMALRPTTPSSMPAKGHFGSNTSLSRASPSPATMSKTTGKPALKIGDRVLVSGSKMGTLRYVGETDFAKGEWAGVELDEKQGKNDGAVAGKRYFDCKPMYGLFAPVHKVARLTSGAGPAKSTATTPTSSQNRSLMSTSLRLSKERSGSQESVSSISSSASSVSRSRAKPGHRSGTLNLTATTSALQKALKEKEEHIEQLLKERDLERSEVARAAAQVDEAEGQMSMMRMEQERYKQDVDDTVHKLRTLVSELQQEKQELVSQLDNEKRKVEDLQFQIEEEAMTKDDMETRTEEEETRFREMERQNQRETERAEKLEQELYAMKAMSKDNAERLSAVEEENLAYLDQIEEITHKLSQAENKIKSYESNRLEEGAKTSQVSIELEEKENKLSELEDLLTTKNKEIKQLSNNLQEVEEDLQLSREKNNHFQNQVEKLTTQLDNQSKASETFNTELQQLKSQISDLQRKLDSSDEKAKRLSDEKIQLEQQMNDMMRNSGDSSKRLSILTEQLQDRNRKIQELQADLSNSTQQSAKLREEKDKLRKDMERERENLTVKHNDIVNTIKLSLQDVQKDLNKSNNKMAMMKEDFEKEKEEALNRKNTELNTMKKSLDQYKSDLEKQEVQTQAHKQVLEKLNMEMEALKFEKEKGDKLVKRLEGEKDAINTDLIHIRVTNSKVQLENEKMVDEKNKLIQEIQDLKEDKDRVSDSKSSIQQEKDQLIAEKTELSEEKDKVGRELVESKASLQEKEIQVEELQKEVEKLKTEINEKEESMSKQSQTQSSDMQAQVDKAQARIKELDGMLQSEISLGEKRVKELEKKLLQQTSDSDQKYNQLEALFKEVEDERDTMKAQLEFSNLVAEERRRLEEQNMQLNQDMEKSEESHRKEIENLENANSKLQKEIANIKNENASLERYRQTSEKQEKENKDLISQINSLKSQIQAQEVNSNTIGLSANQADNKQEVDGQVDFLNSVIVDLQKKNQELKTRLEAMESGVLTNGEADTSLEESGDSKKPPPRLFCDICDVFDKHDTEDCPCQAMDYEDNAPSPSHHHGDRKQLRAYCDICEEFHEPCENLQIPVPKEETGTSEPRVRYRSGSDRVHIEDFPEGSTQMQDILGQSTKTNEETSYNGVENGETKLPSMVSTEMKVNQADDLMTNSQLGIYDDDDFYSKMQTYSVNENTESSTEENMFNPQNVVDTEDDNKNNEAKETTAEEGGNLEVDKIDESDDYSNMVDEQILTLNNDIKSKIPNIDTILAQKEDSTVIDEHKETFKNLSKNYDEIVSAESHLEDTKVNESESVIQERVDVENAKSDDTYMFEDKNLEHIGFSNTPDDRIEIHGEESDENDTEESPSIGGNGNLNVGVKKDANDKVDSEIEDRQDFELDSQKYNTTGESSVTSSPNKSEEKDNKGQQKQMVASSTERIEVLDENLVTNELMSSLSKSPEHNTETANDSYSKRDGESSEITDRENPTDTNKEVEDSGFKRDFENAEDRETFRDAENENAQGEPCSNIVPTVPINPTETEQHERHVSEDSDESMQSCSDSEDKATAPVDQVGERKSKPIFDENKTGKTHDVGSPSDEDNKRDSCNVS